MGPSQEELRRHYESLTDEALLQARSQGRGGYTPQAWEVISAEIAERGLDSRDDAVEAASPETQSLPALAEPMTPEAAVGLVPRLLDEGVPATSVRQRLIDGGLTAEQATLVLQQIVPLWRKAREDAVGKEMLTGGSGARAGCS
jgi:hypothetical protein